MPAEPPRREPSARARAVARALRRIADVEPQEVRPLAWSFLYFFFLLAGYYVLRPLRDEMGIAGGVQHLRWLFTATFAVMLVAVPAWSALVARLPRRRLLPIAYRFSTVNLLLFFAAFQVPAAREATARAFFVWLSVFNLLAVSVFWSFMADLFRSGQGRRLFGLVSAGGSAGAIAGPLLTALLVRRIGPVNLLLVAAALVESATWCVARLSAWTDATAAETPTATAAAATEAASTLISATEPATTATIATTEATSAVPSGGAEEDRGAGGSAWGAVGLLVRSPYLTGIAIYVLLFAITSTFEYLLRARLMAATMSDPAARTALFARIDLLVNVAAAATQALVTGRVLGRLGLGPGLLCAPAIALGAVVAVVSAPRLGIVIAMQALRRVAEYAVARPAREVLYTVLSREEKYKPKALIDTVVMRAGDALAGWGFETAARQGAGIPALAAGTAPLIVAWLIVAVWLTRRHDARARAAPPA